MRRAVLVVFCLALAATLAVVFTRVVAARVPEQRATLEKLINDRTGLAVRFENVHFAWDLDGTSAVFTRVELTDPKAGRIRVIAPELRVELDTWDFLRHHQMSLGHVTLSSPDIDVIGDPEPAIAADAAPREHAAREPAPLTEAALVRRYTEWAELMPTGRIEVEGARVHLRRRGDRAPRLSFTLSQAVVSRGASSFNAFGTMLLSQDVGQSLFVSAQLAGLAPKSTVSGDLRVIARRVFLARLGIPGIDGRGTLDARVALRDGRIEAGSWTASARELELRGEGGPRFDHGMVHGTLARDGDELLVTLADLQLTRDARLERAPRITAHLSLLPGTLRVARTRLTAERVPFMTGELLAGFVVPIQSDNGVPGWKADAGELHDVRFDSGDSRVGAGWRLESRATGVVIVRDADRVSLAGLAGKLRVDPHGLAVEFDSDASATLRMTKDGDAIPVKLAGAVVLARDGGLARPSFDAFAFTSNAARITFDGAWSDAPRAAPLSVELANLDHALATNLWKVLAVDLPLPKLLADFEHGRLVAGTLALEPARDGSDFRAIDWRKSSGSLELADLSTAGADLPRLSAGGGALQFARGNLELKLDRGKVEDLALAAARVDWPRGGRPHLHASLAGSLDSPLLHRALADQGLDQLMGSVSLEADARGDRDIRDPSAWRVNAQLSNASMTLARGLPALQKLAGNVRYGGGQLRSLALAGSWLGGPVEIESRRAARGALNVSMNGVADSAVLLRLLEQRGVAAHVSGEVSWSGTAQRTAGDDLWQLALASNLVGLESRLPEPFDKPRARAIPLSAELRVDGDGLRDFHLESGHDLVVRGQVRDDATVAQFEWQDVSGVLRRAARAAAKPELTIEHLDVGRAAEVLAVAGALLPEDTNLDIGIGEVRGVDRSFGAVQASLIRDADRIEFTLDSPGGSPHQISARGGCDAERCRAEFTADTSQLAMLTRGVQLPSEWPADTLHASGELSWPAGGGDLARTMEGHFELETQGADSNHTLAANATLAEGQIQLTNVQGTGPAADQVFRGSGRLGLVSRDYDVSLDYEQVSLAATAVPSSARARFSRAWNALRGSIVRRGAPDEPQIRRVQWHGNWEYER